MSVGAVKDKATSGVGARKAQRVACGRLKLADARHRRTKDSASAIRIHIKAYPKASSRYEPITDILGCS